MRRGRTVQGPYSSEDVRSYLLLGRLRLSDRVSHDAHTWQPLTQCPELIPDAMRDLASESGRARFEAARRAIDERAQDRDALPPDAVERRAAPARVWWWRPGTASLLATVVVVAVVLAGIGYSRDFKGGMHAEVSCGAAAGAGAVWSGCIKDGIAVAQGTDLTELRAVNASLRSAELAGADLRGARLEFADLSQAHLTGADLEQAVLRGADLRGADLATANLTRADLRYADLRSADLDGVNLQGARLGRALWPDGVACAPNSVGRCRR
jgi:hypothetical protein